MESVTATQPLAGLAIGHGVPAKLARRVRDWASHQLSPRRHVTVYMRRGGDAQLCVSVRVDEELVVVLNEAMSVDEHPRDVARRAHALRVLSLSWPSR